MCKPFNDLRVKLGDILVSQKDTCFFTKGVEYEVKQADDGRLGLMTDCGFVATTSSTLFSRKGVLDGYPAHDAPKKVISKIKATPSRIRDANDNQVKPILGGVWPLPKNTEPIQTQAVTRK